MAPSPGLPLEILVPIPGQPGEHIHVALFLLIKQAGHTSYLGMPLHDCFSDLAYRHWPGFVSSLILRRKEGLCVPSDDACSERSAIYLATLGGKRLVYQSWPGCSPPDIISTCAPKDRPLLLGNMFWVQKKGGADKRYAMGLTWGHTAEDTVSLYNVLYMRPPSHGFVFSHGSHTGISFPSLHWLLEG